MMRVPTFVVIGGGPIGSGSVRQLLRARDAGRLETERIIVVDRNPQCLAKDFSAPAQLHVSDWVDWLSAHLGGLGRDDHLVPDHWAPHLLQKWLAGEVARAGGTLVPAPLELDRRFPVERTTRDGDRALSYATWLCPPRCIEPALCPHTRGPKDWSLAQDLVREGPRSIVFQCLHLVYGVGTVPVADILAARDRVLSALAAGPERYLVATSSHCHALAGAILVTPPCDSPPPDD
jgi:hypothetical protein